MKSHNSNDLSNKILIYLKNYLNQKRIIKIKKENNLKLDQQLLNKIIINLYKKIKDQ